VCDKQESGLSFLLSEKPFEVKSSNHRFTRTGGGYYQIAPAVVGVTFPLQCFKDALLKRVRLKVKEDCRAS
jgi:hypothetical protein